MIVAVIPTYREPIERIERTVRSALVIDAIDRVIVVDDGGGDVAIERSGRVHVLSLPENRGVSAAMNAAIATLPPSAVICRLDVGDVFYPEAKARQLDAAWDRVMACHAFASFSRHFDAVDASEFSPPAAWRNRIYTDGVFCICTAVFTRTAWELVGGFDESLRYGDDWDFAMRVERELGWDYFPEVTCEAGAHPGGHTRTADIDPAKRARRDADTAVIRARAAELKRRR